MIFFCASISNPFRNHEYKVYWEKMIPVGRYKALELELVRGSLIGVDFIFRPRGDHAPELNIGIALLGYEFGFHLYDSRHKEDW